MSIPDPLIREPGTSVAFPRPMFELVDDFGETYGWHDSAKWPDPWPFYDLDQEGM